MDQRPDVPVDQEPAPPRPEKQEKRPASDQVTEVAPGVLRMQLPVSIPGLGHVNAYLLEDERGATVVDAGMPGQDTWTALTARLADAQVPLGRVHTVVVTHSHPDHYGTAGRLVEESGADLVTHAAFIGGARPHRHASVDDDDPAPAAGAGDAPVPGNPYDGPTPWGGTSPSPDLVDQVRRSFRRSDRHHFAPPTPTRLVEDGERLSMGGRDWVAVHTPGHTLDHLCVYDPTEGLLITGDHVLPTITPHISGIGTGPDPLAQFLASLSYVAGFEVRTALPAHGDPFDDLAGRVESISRHHAERLEMLRIALAETGPADVDELSHAIFQARSWGPMASSETYAHLEHLRLLGDAARWDDGGVLTYGPTR
jgi:glyoxylase-like metal-dependent hydrolase (beta-lactamase superfamily II)